MVGGMLTPDVYCNLHGSRYARKKRRVACLTPCVLPFAIFRLGSETLGRYPVFRYLVALLSFAAMVTQPMRFVPAIVVVGTAAGTNWSQPSPLDEPAFAENEPTSKEVGSTGALPPEKDEAKMLFLHPLSDGEFAIEQKSDQANFASSMFSNFHDAHSVAVKCGIFSAMAGLICAISNMVNPNNWRGAGGSSREPPSWNSDTQGRSFQTWVNDLMFWSIRNSDMDASQQTAAIITQIEGSARALCNRITIHELQNGGIVTDPETGVQAHVDPLTFLLFHLGSYYAPLSEETRTEAINDLLNFRRRPNESFDSLVSRFTQVRWTAANTNGGTVMSVEGYAWYFLRAAGCSERDMRDFLQPLNYRYPATEQEFQVMITHMRRVVAPALKLVSAKLLRKRGRRRTNSWYFRFRCARSILDSSGVKRRWTLWLKRKPRVCTSAYSGNRNSICHKPKSGGGVEWYGYRYIFFRLSER